VKVQWTENAISQLLGIYDYIARDSPFYAKRMVDRLTERSRQLRDFSLSGRVVPEYDDADIRELVEKPYRMIYFLGSDQIKILAVVHSSQRLPSEL
jgi:toxin ParE1/3/4